jgi:hypothetical protein
VFLIKIVIFISAASRINHVLSISAFLTALKTATQTSANFYKIDMAPKRSKPDSEQEEHYKTVRAAKDAHYGSRNVPLCKSCYEGHLRCPGPEIGSDGGWDFSVQCQRCADGGEDIECDFEAEMTRT